MIIIDGRTSDKKISNFENLEQILTAVAEEDDMRDRVVTDVSVNGEPFSEIYPHQAEDIASDSIEKVEVRSESAVKMAQEISGEMEKVARMMSSGAETVARLFREAKDSDALELFQDLLDVTRDYMNMITHLRRNYVVKDNGKFAPLADKFGDLLSEMTDVLGNEDWILLADLLEYEFKPLCAEWREMSESLHAQIAGSK